MHLDEMPFCFHQAADADIVTFPLVIEFFLNIERLSNDVSTQSLNSAEILLQLFEFNDILLVYRIEILLHLVKLRLDVDSMLLDLIFNNFSLLMREFLRSILHFFINVFL